jgi:outer membrane immunogenic protein
MKRQLIMGAVVAAYFATPAKAADLKVLKAAPKIVPVATWTGCYVGAHIGYGWSRKENSDNPSSNWFLGQPATVDADGLIGGGQIGCDYQLNPAFVVGVEVDYVGAGLRGSTSPPVPFLTSLTVHARTDSIGTVTGRLGYSFSGFTLLYVKGGGAWAHNKYSADWALAPFGGTITASETRSGWTLGVGLEHIFAPNWSARIEYDYYNFGTRAVTFPVGAPAVGTYYIGDIHHDVSAVKLGVNYRFGGPIVARY